MTCLEFIGAWLLFAGPIYQAALELQDEDIEIDRVKLTGAKIKKAAQVSLWWWLLPPAKIYMERKRSHKYWTRYIKTLPSNEVEALVSYRSKANAWLFITVGGFFIAISQSYSLAKEEDWNNYLLALIIIFMFFLSILNLVTRLRRARKIVNS